MKEVLLGELGLFSVITIAQVTGGLSLSSEEIAVIAACFATLTTTLWGVVRYFEEKSKQHRKEIRDAFLSLVDEKDEQIKLLNKLIQSYENR